jgi:hypothetical protein
METFDIEPPETTESALFMYGRFNGVRGDLPAPMSPPAPPPPGPRPQSVMASKFRVRFEDFGDGVADIGKDVQTITLPSLMFATYREGNEYKTDSASWNPVCIVFKDCVDNAVMHHVMVQIKKQIEHDDGDGFTVILDLLDTYGVIRRYIHTGCRISYSGHERELDYVDPSIVRYTIQVQPVSIEILDGNNLSLTKTRTVKPTDPDDDPLYEPISR